MVARFLAKDRRALEALETANGVAARALEDFVEENSGEDSILEGARDDKGVVKKGLVKELLPQVRGDEESTKVLAECLELIEAVTEAERTFKHALVALDVKVLSEYGELSEAKVKELVIGPKWLNSIRAQIVGEVDHTVNRLVSRLTELEERYATPLPSLQSEVVRFDGLVTNHLRAMGLRIS